jgi:putative Mg2+ transporter-C (MgtC) family protein
MDTLDGLWHIDSQAWEFVGVVLIKMTVAALLASIVGWERERHGRPAGIRTHMLVAIGVVLFTDAGRGFSSGDPSRVASQVVTGIGFLGAGTILRTGFEVKGLTTAASIWAVAAIAMAVSLSGPYLVIAVIGTAITMLTLSVVDNIERRIIPEQNISELCVALQPGVNIKDLLKDMDTEGIELVRTEIASTEPEIELHLRVKGDRQRILETVSGLPGVRTATWLN